MPYCPLIIKMECFILTVVVTMFSRIIDSKQIKSMSRWNSKYSHVGLSIICNLFICHFDLFIETVCRWRSKTRWLECGNGRTENGKTCIFIGHTIQWWALRNRHTQILIISNLYLAHLADEGNSLFVMVCGEMRYKCRSTIIFVWKCLQFEMIPPKSSAARSLCIYTTNYGPFKRWHAPRDIWNPSILRESTKL